VQKVNGFMIYKRIISQVVDFLHITYMLFWE